VYTGRPRSAGGELKCSKKRKRDDTEPDDDDTVDEASENDGKAGSETGDDNSAGGESGNEEQDGEDVEDEDAGRDGSTENGPADDDSQDGVLLRGPLSADSPWPYQPARTEISKLATCLDLDDSTANGLLPRPTARDAIVNALASVKFLTGLGRSALLPSQLGIDSAGRLFKVGSSEWQRNYRDEFCDLVRVLKENREETEIKAEIKQHLQTYADIGWSGYLSDCTGEETEPLLSLIETVLKESDFGVSRLGAVLAECKKAAAAMDKTVSLVNGVKQDLLDTGSTSMKRWHQLKKIRWLRPFRWPSQLTDLTPDGIRNLVQEKTDWSERSQGSLGLTLKLKRELVCAIEQLHYLAGTHLEKDMRF
jgi:hypothetical protein